MEDCNMLKNDTAVPHLSALKWHVEKKCFKVFIPFTYVASNLHTIFLILTK
jgi:hypothetical protein